MLVERAKLFASAAHAAIGQRRRYTDEPYIVHPTEVAAMVASVTDDEEMIAAAYLHDVVEDTQVTHAMILEFFGPSVAQLVEEVTDISRPQDGNRRTRKEIDRQHLAKASPRAKTIKLADLISNSTNIIQHDRWFAKDYMREKKLLLEVLSEGDCSLYQRAQNITNEYYAEREVYRLLRNGEQGIS
ncbi:Guanosine polyphosphate pyrophosphohydrolase/synthetases [Hahella chejuensis KCTC 2396]|uniref:Guanosine polyphosphate pyrophosphohydrolase/synthetases n=1 Tax=Hahella chejuensis (strain KCTC 2396) TaxID=349521 RepID=Q2SJ02_HAHCH|nr:HD domain-containing protein [Hahella chejuensis]ABC29372.1 Guanosine polyphosphate pyrophosphohydrolase/synthetases [Hahella chejuensis KCTC 2396]